MYKATMLKIYQQTLNNSVSFNGVGLHNGKKCALKINPSENNSGIIFKRVDLQENNLIVANYNNVTSAKLCTTLANEFGIKVSTVEHLLAALYIAEVDNAVIEIDNEEVPIMDGSAKPFLEAFLKAGTKQLNQERKYLKILKKFEFSDGERKISIEPSEKSFEVEFQLNYKNKIIGKQKNSINFLTDDLEKVYESRTFCLFEDIEKIKKIGLAKGGSLNNAVVVEQDKVLNKEGLRNNNEFVNHKILDLVGDFLLSGYRVLGKVKCYQGGHHLSNMFLKDLMETTSSFKTVAINQIKLKEKPFQVELNKLAVSA